MNSDAFDKFIKALDEETGYGRCFDLSKRPLTVGGRRAYFYFATSLSNDLILSRIITALIEYEKETDSFDTIIKEAIVCADATLKSDVKEIARAVLSGMSALTVDGIEGAVVMETRSLPTRGIEEPESDHVLKGSHDGFSESLIKNIGLIRRRIRSQRLNVEKLCVGKESKSDIALCYLDGKCDEDFLSKLRADIESIRVDALALSQESLAECLVPKRWFNFFPKFRYTERPDAAAAMILEGSVIVICDNSPQVMILPCAILDFVGESNDFYFPPVIGTYLRAVRITVFLLTLFMTPIWYLLLRNPEYIPSFFSFAFPDSLKGPPVLFQLLLVEFTIDALKLASLNTPSSLGSSLSVVAGLIIGDFAVQTGWLSGEVILYMSFVAMANFTQPSYELGYAFKFSRVLLLILIAIADLWGFIIGLSLILMLIVFGRRINSKYSYLYPILPFDKRALKRQLLRVKLMCGKKK